jgi:hypothetical protein
MIKTLLPRKLSAKKIDAPLEPFNAIRETMSGIAPTANPSSKLASNVIVVKMMLGRWPQTTIAQSIRWTWRTLALKRRGSVTKLHSVLDAGAIFLRGSFPVPTLCAMYSPNFFAYTNSLDTLSRRHRGLAAVIFPYATSTHISASSCGERFAAMRQTQTRPMLVCERPAFPMFAESAQ